MRRTMSYDDDEDLDALRLAALQTLNIKGKSNPIQVVESVPHHKPRYDEEIYPFGGSNGQWPEYPPYVAPTPSDVQLSPRSAAFVQQNTSILRRRKGDKSPSVSPPYKSTAVTPWEPGSPFRSRTPSPPSPKRFYSPRVRSVSRSPPPPVDSYRIRRRTRSRSPPVRRQSPRFAGRSRNSSPRPVRSRRQSPRVSPPVRSVRKPSRSPVRVTRHRSQSPPVIKRAKSPVRKPRRPREAPLPRRRTPERHMGKYKNDRRPRNPPRDAKEEKKLSPRPRKRSRSRSPEKRPDKEATPEKIEEEKVPEDKSPCLEEKEESEGEMEIDGIDLFASEESESENEGRFKSSSKSERPAQVTVSFSKLVTEPVASLTELKDLPTLSSVAAPPRRPERSAREYNRSRRKRDRDRRSNRHRDSKTKDTDKESRLKSKHGESNMKMFKSTFQAVVVNDTKKQANDSASGDVPSEKGAKDGDKRKIIQIKRPVSFRETKDKPDAEPQPNGQSSVGVGEGKVKKSIHLRLGGYATPNGEPSSSSLASVLAATSKTLKSGNLASLKKSWKTSEKV